MKIPAFVNVLLATALVVLSIKITFGDSAETDSHSGGRGVSDGITSATSRVSSASAYDMILSRTSIREYADRAVGSETVDSLLKAGMAAPTAGNRQPWKFIVVDDSSLIASIGSAAKAWAPVGRAPIAIIVCGDKSAAFDDALNEYWIQDCSAVSENILLSAHAMGLGAVWCGCYPQKDREEFIVNLFGLPDNIVPLNVIAIGYPKESHRPKDKYRQENIHYNGW